ncbi:MAG: phosphoribosylamine--glycine ligase [Clostridia bacterium]|jgi:phosphoribosylamine--glycine ligase|nr:phosphoribosylamine--glycine ligase [Clostridia bacterium]
MKKYRVLVVGSGGREHTLVWKLAQSEIVSEIYCAPGNGGIRQYAECIPVQVDDISGLVDLAKAKNIDIVVVGPELPLTLGLVDALEAAGIKAFGPSKRAAEIEGSKAFAKDLLQKYGIPTARYGVFTDRESAVKFAREMNGPWVVKADGLAAGKGVIIAQTYEEAEQAVREIMSGEAVGQAGAKIVIEEFLEGEELSILAFCDGKTIVPMSPAQDHKRIFDNDQGPNTGGMGAYTPVPAATPGLMAEIDQKILQPVIQAMAKEGRPYCGVLYPGLMLTKEGPKVLEFNCRFGDPETQVVLPRVESDLGEIILAVLEGKLEQIQIKWRQESCITVVMASGGYPGKYQTGLPITGLESKTEDGALVFHSGTALQDGRLVTAGGRVLSVTALGRDLQAAREKAYRQVEKISFSGAQFRRDIAYRALPKA